MQKCSSLKDDFGRFYAAELSVSQERGACIVTLPSKTIDDRCPDVFIEEKLDRYLVHDGGKTASELFAQAVHLTESREQALQDMAQTLGATFSDGMFRAICSRDELEKTILLVGDCAVMASWLLLQQKPVFTDVPIIARVDRGLQKWRVAADAQIMPRFKATGTHETHTFDFAAFENQQLTKFPAIGVKVLRPGDSSISKAREYGWMVKDLENTMFNSWYRLAIITRSDVWTKDAAALVRDMASDTIQVETGAEDELEVLIPEHLARVA